MKRGYSGELSVSGDRAQSAVAPGPLHRLGHRVDRLSDLRREGLRLINEGDIEGLADWHHQWAAALNSIRTHIELNVPREAELVSWPAVNGTQPLGQVRVDLVRSAVGCRELTLLVAESGGLRGDGSRLAQGLLSPGEAQPWSTYVGAGQRFRGAVRLRQLIEPARESLVVIDPYMDDATFTLAATADSEVARRFLSSSHAGAMRGVTEAWADWHASWDGRSECRIGRELPHFRLLVVDGAAYHVDASLKDFGASLTFYRPLPTDELRQIEDAIECMWNQAASVELGSAASAA